MNGSKPVIEVLCVSCIKRIIDFNVAYALVTGIINRDEVPQVVQEAIAHHIAFYEDLKARNELRMPDE